MSWCVASSSSIRMPAMANPAAPIREILLDVGIAPFHQGANISHGRNILHYSYHESISYAFVVGKKGGDDVRNLSSKRMFTISPRVIAVFVVAAMS